MYANCLKTETNPNKKWNLVRMSLEHATLPLPAQRSTDWASGPLDTYVLQVNNFDAVNVCKLLKKRNNPNKKWNRVRMSSEHATLAFSPPRSTDWASGPLIIIK